MYVLIQWSDRPKEDATWELYTDIQKKFPKFNLEASGQALLRGINLIQLILLITCLARVC